MEINNSSYQFKDLLEKAKKILILLGGKPNADLVSAGIALSHVLKSHSKSAHLVSVNSLPDTTSVISGVEEVKRDLESKNLVISLNYEKNPIDKISYKVEGKTFNLIVKPKKGFNLDEVQTSFTGGDYNLIIILGTQDLKELKIYAKHKDLFESLPTVNIDTDESNTRFGKLNIIDPQLKSVSALISLLLNEVKIKLPEKSANLLLLGMREATQNFTNVSDSRIFEAAAYTTKAKEIQQGTEKETFEEKVNKDLPEDWLSPKVYRSSKVS